MKSAARILAWLLPLLSLASLGWSQTCNADQTLVNGRCVNCPQGLERPSFLPQTSECIVYKPQCFNTINGPNPTRIFCFRNTAACKIPCGQTMRCTQSRLSCPGTQVLNSTRICSAGEGSVNSQQPIQCTSSFCCTNGPCFNQPNGTACNITVGNPGVCRGGVCLLNITAPVFCNSTQAGPIICPFGSLIIPGRTCVIGTNCTTTVCCQGVCTGQPIGASCDDFDSFTYNDRCNSQGLCQGIAATCSDGLQNGDETGVDCGGLSCPTCPTCSDGIRNGFETGTDCGGPRCVSCNATCSTAGVTCSILPNTTLLSSRFCVRNINCTVAQCCVNQCFGQANGSNCTAAGNIPGRCSNNVCVSTLTTCSSQTIACPSGYSNGSITCIPGLTCNVATCCVARVSVVSVNNNPPTSCTPQLNGQCLCSSGLYGSACATRVVGCDITQQPLFVNTSSMAAVAGATLNNDNVTITVALEMVENREYLSVRLGNCTIRNFTLTLLTTDATSCRDVWSITLPVSRLPLCGFSAVDVANVEQFTGAVNLQYQDRVTAGGILTTRITMATIPWRLNLNDEYRASLAIGGVKITSPVALTAAITAVAISATSTSARLAVTLTTQSPYQVGSINTNIQTISTNGPTARVVTSTTFQPIASPQLTPSPCTVYTPSANCLQGIAVEVLLNGACRIDTAFSLANITFSCGPAITAEDCPILGASAVATVSFNVQSGDICMSNAVASTVDRTVTVVRFFSPSMTSLLRNDSVVAVPRRAYRPNETLVLRADFAGLAVFSMQLNAVSTSYLGGPMTLRYNANPLDMVPQIPSTMLSGNVNGVSLGFDQLRQSFLMAHPINAAFGITGNGPVRGAAANLAVQATVDMSYSPDVLAGRRRRRHAGGDIGVSRPLQTLVTTVDLLPFDAVGAGNNVASEPLASADRNYHHDHVAGIPKTVPIGAAVGGAVAGALAIVAMAVIAARIYNAKRQRATAGADKAGKQSSTKNDEMGSMDIDGLSATPLDSARSEDSRVHIVGYNPAAGLGNEYKHNGKLYSIKPQGEFVFGGEAIALEPLTATRTKTIERSSGDEAGFSGPEPEPRAAKGKQRPKRQPNNLARLLAHRQVQESLSLHRTDSAGSDKELLSDSDSEFTPPPRANQKKTKGLAQFLPHRQALHDPHTIRRMDSAGAYGGLQSDSESESSAPSSPIPMRRSTPTNRNLFIYGASPLPSNASGSATRSGNNSRLSSLAATPLPSNAFNASNSPRRDNSGPQTPRLSSLAATPLPSNALNASNSPRYDNSGPQTPRLISLAASPMPSNLSAGAVASSSFSLNATPSPSNQSDSEDHVIIVHGENAQDANQDDGHVVIF